ncbi:phosphomannomutase [Sulfurovum sp.]|uniref:phosphomannomutase n=1 Tax=Sulfurovum sp. TaxID=1969726 RepID=UPI0025D3CC91|nr:phosphomannomutase [Sulfurovum sp.]
MIKKYKISQLMQESGVNFGTSGARGLVSAMTDRVCFAYTVGFLEYLKTQDEFFPGKKVAIAGDLRPSTKRIKHACKKAIEYCGGEAIDVGEVPTPTLCYYSYAKGYPSLMVTGSHIPDDRNGIKFNRSHGEFLKPDEAGMRQCDVDLDEDLFDNAGMLLDVAEEENIVDISKEYISRYVDFFGEKSLEGIKLGVYEHSAVGRDIVTAIVKKLGAEVVSLGRSETFIPVDTEAVREEDISLAKKWSSTLGLDAILTTDGDSDRPLLADENGEWIRGDVLGILASLYVNAKGVATPISCNTALELTENFLEVQRTKIGSPYVVEAMNELTEKGVSPVVGYEANGGFLLNSTFTQGDKSMKPLPTRDALLPMLCALMSVKKDVKTNTLSEVIATLPERYTLSDRIQNIPRDQSLKILEPLMQDSGYKKAEKIFECLDSNVRNINCIDGVRINFDTDDIIHLRPSGNAPELRIYVESNSIDGVDRLLETTFSIVKSWV